MNSSIVLNAAGFAFKKLLKFWWVSIPRIIVNGFIIGALVFTLCVAGVYGYGLYGSGSATLKTIVLAFATPLIITVISAISIGVTSLFIIAADTQIALDLYDNRPTPFFMFNQIGNGVIILLASILISIATFFAFFLLIFPAIYLSLRWMFSAYSVVDLHKGPFSALAHSWRSTKKIKRPLFWISLFIVIAICVKIFFLWKWGNIGALATLASEKPMGTLQALQNSNATLMYLKTQSSWIIGTVSLLGIILFSLTQLFITGLYGQLRSEK